jgi:hypothetical protein
MLTLTAADRDKIRALLQASTAAKNLMKVSDLEAIISSDRNKLMAAIKAAQAKDNVVRLHSGHVVVYDMLIEGYPMEHLSVSHAQDHPVTESDMVIIAMEFGLGDRASWTMCMPPRPPLIRAFHVMRKIG